MNVGLLVPELLISGYKIFNDKEILYLISDVPPISSWTIKPDTSGTYTPAEKINLEPAHDYIKDNYVDKYFNNSTKGYNNIWNSTEESSMLWHNDLVEGPNLFFMYYLNDVINNGEICFRINGEETGKIKPKKGLLLMGSQELYVEHKVNHTDETRVVCNFGFYV
tara:strand:- start:300 stop:794 length:495 start_codon:yes stop_codon:yes gene_type:complete